MKPICPTISLYRLKALSIAKKSDFQSLMLQTDCHSQGSDSRLEVQVRVHPGLRDYDKSFILTPESWEIAFCFVAMDPMLLYIMYR